MKVYVGGAKFLQGQTQRIEKGFVELGHEITPHTHDADLIYVNNSPYDQEIKDKIAGVKGKVIFTVLDLAPHLGESFPVEKLKEQLSYADEICTISEFVKNDLLNRTKFNSTVVYQPIKNITNNRCKISDHKFLFVGRVNDAAKRCGLGAGALSILGYNANEILTIGSEMPYFGGDYYGVASDSTLDKFYNSADYLIFTGYSEGLGLPPFEAIAAGCIPIICNDLNVREEFFPSSIFPEYAAINPTIQSIASFITSLENDQDKKREFITRLRNHYRSSWETNLSGREVAKKIISVYEDLIKKDFASVL
jgi:glycosyltransferase involved in cell wall biosynthesis